MSSSKYVFRYAFLCVPLLFGSYWLYTQGAGMGKLPECMLVIASVLGFLPLAFGFNILGSNGVRKAYARRAGEIDMSFVVYLLVDNDERAEKRRVKLVFCDKGFIFDNGQRFLLRVLYGKVRDWDVRNGKLSIQVKDKWVLREYDVDAQNPMQLLALVKHMRKHVPKDVEEPSIAASVQPSDDAAAEEAGGAGDVEDVEGDVLPEGDAPEEELFDIGSFLEPFIRDLTAGP